jgi:hypothetical protein
MHLQTSGIASVGYSVTKKQKNKTKKLHSTWLTPHAFAGYSSHRVKTQWQRRHDTWLNIMFSVDDTHKDEVTYACKIHRVGYNGRTHDTWLTFSVDTHGEGVTYA